MSRGKDPQIVTANDLRSGAVVYLTADGTWSRALRDAELLADPEAASARLAEAGRRGSEVVGPYLAPARRSPGGVEPTHIREAIRLAGPSRQVLPQSTGIV